MAQHRGSGVKQQANTLYVPNKFLLSVPTYHKEKGTVHYLLERRRLEKAGMVYIDDIKSIRTLGIIFPSGRVTYVKLVKVEVGEEKVRFVTYHKQETNIRKKRLYFISVKRGEN